jgi:ADP-heptose:LPS heptosyltransferase
MNFRMSGHNKVKEHPRGERETIVILGPPQLGDSLLLFPFVKYLQKTHKDLRFVIGGSQDLFSLARYFDVRVEICKQSEVRHTRFVYFFRMLRLLAKIRPSISISFSSDGYHLYHFLQAVARVPFRVGFAHKGLAIFLTNVVRFDATTTRIENIGRLLYEIFPDQNLLNRDLILKDWESYIPEPSRRNGYRIGICTTATHPFVWSPQSWLSLLRFISASYPTSKFVFVGVQNMEKSSNVISQFEREYPHSVINMIGKTTLVDLARLLLNMDILITLDTGTRHLANLLGVPMIVLRNSANSNFEWGCYGKREFLLSSPQECSPCGLRECKYDFVRCMEGIQVSHVCAALKNMLSLHTPETT